LLSGDEADSWRRWLEILAMVARDGAEPARFPLL
jgi:hypothetical protein